MKKLWNTIALLIIFSVCMTLSANDTLQTYFPATPDSFWVYEDQDGNEITRRAIDGEEIAGETYYAFEYEPAFDDWENYEYYIHPMLFKVDDDGIKVIIGDEVKNAYKEIIENEIKSTMEETPAPPEFNLKFDVKVDVEAQDHFLLLPTQFSLNEKWKSIRIKPSIKIIYSMISDEVDTELAGFSQAVTVYFTIMESGMITSKESVETEAGKFENCLKIRIDTKTITASGFSIATSYQWLAPDLGPVKFETGQDIIFELISFNLVTPTNPYDVNEDGVVNILDLTFVASRFGETDPEADVNDDGKVNILDLVRVAQHFGN